MSSQLWLPVFAEEEDLAVADPIPIPTGTILPFATGPFRFFFPGAGNQVSTIGNFKGFVGGADVPFTEGSDGLVWKADVRYLKGTYVGQAGKTRHGAFAFV